MGNVLRLLSLGGSGNEDSSSSCCTSKNQEIFLDFENALPSHPQEQILYQRADNLLNEASGILKDLSEYRGASKEIREAIGKPCEASERAAWAALEPLVFKLRNFYVFSLEMQGLAPMLINGLTQNDTHNYNTSQGSILETLDDRQALVKQLAKILDFVLKFDEIKMSHPAIQNDFSYYRRVTARENFKRDLLVEANMAGAMSYFFGHATPMLDKLSVAVANSMESEDDPQRKNRAVIVLGVMAKVCQKMLATPGLKARIVDETELFILRVMTAIIILYDHAHPDGVFYKNSHVDVKGCLKILREQEKSRVESLFNALRYTTKHINDQSTPKSTKLLVFEELS